MLSPLRATHRVVGLALAPEFRSALRYGCMSVRVGAGTLTGLLALWSGACGGGSVAATDLFDLHESVTNRTGTAESPGCSTTSLTISEDGTAHLTNSASDECRERPPLLVHLAQTGQDRAETVWVPTLVARGNHAVCRSLPDCDESAAFSLRCSRESVRLGVYTRAPERCDDGPEHGCAPVVVCAIEGAVMEGLRHALWDNEIALGSTFLQVIRDPDSGSSCAELYGFDDVVSGSCRSEE